MASAKRAACENVGGSGESVGCSETLMFPTVGGVGGVGVSIRVLGYSIEFMKASFVSSFMPSGSDSSACFLCSLLMPFNA